MYRTLRLSAILATLGVMGAGAENPSSIYDFTLDDIDGAPRSLADFRGQVVLIVNVASKCGFTYQYEGLQALYERYRDRGFTILGFPTNDFLGQEPGSEEQIKNFCSLTYGVDFPMFSKIVVKGRKIHPLYAHLTSKKTNPEHGGRITWNFNKFLLGTDGEILARFGSKDEPESEELVAAVERALGS